MRWLSLMAGAAILAGTATKALEHMVMVPMEDPARWFTACACGLVLVGLAVMPREG